ncbi:MFS transporter [Piscinibacter defluvii]|uniref:MFS transporter n=1 Tax=Piscinibacter defluvii TaxID=1796922 RepID=UPI001F0C6CC3|nr:MFS transporter [Piscinibacter defluvii]
MLRKAAAASFIGNFVEWFDYASYGYLATVIAVVFFPRSSPAAGLIAAYGVFAVSFIVRPIGGVIWGHLGDRIGRRTALSLSILIMSAATFLIALLPSYEQVGLWSPALLLLVRIVQGFSASGEYAGASAFLAEYAPAGRRGFYTSIVPASTAAGLLFGSLLVAAMHALLTPEQLHSWGWRLPFLLAAPFGLIGRYIRVRLEDTPKFQQLESAHHVAKAPIRELLGTHRRAIVIAFGVTCLNAVAFYIILSYMPTYLSTEMGMGESESFLATTISLAAYIGLIFLMGKLSDRLGRRTMLIAASVLFVLLTVPLFRGLAGAGFLGIVAIQIAFGALLTMNDGTLPCFLSEIFPTKVRYSGFALTFNSANALFGGTAPLIATWLIQATGSKLAPAWLLVAAAGVALAAMLASRETAWGELQDE